MSFGSIFRSIAPRGVLVGTAYLLLKDPIRYGREDETDREIRELIKTKGIFFGIPYLTTDQRANWIGHAEFGKESSLQGRLPKYTVMVDFKNEKIQFEKINSFLDDDFDEETLKKINAYSVQTLKKMNAQSFLSFMWGFRPASERMMIQSAKSNAL